MMLGERGSDGLQVDAGFRPVGDSDIISNTAPTPTVRMRIYKATGQEANNVDLGELLTLKIEMEQTSAFAIFARNLEARTDNGEIMTLIDNIGCPRYPSIFPELEVEERTKSLFGNFKAFRFPSTARVNFVATIRFCQERCEPVSCGAGVVSYGRRRRRAANSTLYDTESKAYHEDELEDDEMVLELETAGSTTEDAFTLSVTAGGSVDSTLIDNLLDTTRTTKRSTSSSTRYSRSTSPSTSTSTSSSTATPKAEVDHEEDLEEEEEDVSMPGDIPVALSLVVGEDTMPEGWDKHDRYRYRDETYVADDYVCTPTSTVIAAVLTLLVLLCAISAGFVFFYRSKKRHWQKMGSCEPFPIPPQPKSQFYNSPEVMFRAAYGGFPGQSNMASNMAAFGTPQALSPMHEESPQYKE